MKTQKLTSKDYFKSIQIIHIAFILGLVFLALISYFLQSQGFGSINQELNSIALIIIPIIALLAAFISNLVFKNGLKKILNSSLPEKMTDYRSALVIKFAIVEAAAFITIVAYLTTGEILLLGIAALLIFLFVTFKPSINRLVNDLELSREEAQKLDNPDSVIEIILKE